MDSFVLYRSTLDALRALEPQDFMDAVCMIAEYEMDGKVPDKPGVGYAMFLSVRPLIDKRKKCAEAGRIGGLKRANASRVLEGLPEGSLNRPLEQIQGKEEIRKKKEEIYKEKEKEKEKKEKEIPYGEIIGYLNEKAGTSYRASSAETRKHIHARWEERYTIDDFKRVIDNKVSEWKGTEWEKFLRPATLFGTKFESYLNGKKGKAKNRFNNFEQRGYEWSSLERGLLNAGNEG